VACDWSWVWALVDDALVEPVAATEPLVLVVSVDCALLELGLVLAVEDEVSVDELGAVEELLVLVLGVED